MHVRNRPFSGELKTHRDLKNRTSTDVRSRNFGLEDKSSCRRRVAFVNFVIIGGTDMGQPGDIKAKAADIATEASKRAGNARTDKQHRVRLTQAQPDAISNRAGLF
jgi:hypothetical protein